MLQLIGSFCAGLDSPAGAALQVLMAELDHERGHAVKEFMMSRVIGPVQVALLAVLRRGELRGDVRAGAPAQLIADVAVAMLMYRSKIDQRVPPPEFCAQLVDEVLVPLVRV